MNYLPSRLTLAAIASTVALSGQAADQTTAPAAAPEIEEIVVSAAPLNRNADDLTQPVHILDREELLTKAGQSIGETLANELGLSSTYFGPIAGRPIIRG